MKRNMKIAALALALSLCLLMTGCYVAPDEVTNSGDNRSGNSLPFDTLPPTATVTFTPDTVTVETPAPNQGQQNIFPDSSTPTPAPNQGQDQTGNNSWNNWGDSGSATPTPIPTSGTIVFNVTPVPGAENTIQTVTATTPGAPAATTPAVATPTATPLTMRKGFTGEAVRTVQRRLKELGYLSGPIDGDFGEATDKAVKAFQKANGLAADGKVGEQTLKKLNDKNAKTYKQSIATAKPKATAKPTAKPTKKVTATPRPTATPNLSKDYYLRLGDSGKRVETLQRRLIELGWLAGKVTGNFDAATDAAVRAFQDKTKGIYTDGVAGPDTLAKLYAKDAAKSKTAVASNAVETLEYDSEGSAVTKLQSRLKDLGYLSGSVDGKFGVETEAAVIAFQKNNNLKADGKAGKETQNTLYSSAAKKARGKAVDIETKKQGGRDTKDIASTGYETLEFGSAGDAVRRIQARLKELGYEPGYTDGKFGANTEAAVMAFQSNNHLTVDGKAGPATQRVLYGTSPNTAVTYYKLEIGNEGPNVRNLQYTLYELGYYDGAIDGLYGQTTSDAVRAFQIMNQLTPVDGIAGNKTLSLLYSSAAIAATAPSTNYSTVRLGDEGNTVVEVQDALAGLNYLTENDITGYYDEKTKAAVAAFQADFNAANPNSQIKVDGVCGPDTMKMLFGY